MNLNWFDTNYLENRKQIEFLLEKAEKAHKCTKEQIEEGCRQLRLGKFKMELLETHIRLLVHMIDYGINAHIAGTKLRQALEDTNAYNNGNISL